MPRPLLVQGHPCWPEPAHRGRAEWRAGWEHEKDGPEGGKLRGEHRAITKLTVLGKFGGAHESRDLEGVFADGAAPKTLHAPAGGRVGLFF